MTRTDGQHIDGKYEVVSELGRAGAETLYAVVPDALAPDGVTAQAAQDGWRLGWFEATTPAARATFHAYRQALRDLDPAGLADVVTRPGAYYTLWKPLAGTPLADFLALPSRDAESARALRELIARLAAHGYPAEAAELVFVDGEPQLARLAPLATTPEDADARNAALLTRLGSGRLRRRRRRVSFGLFVLSVLPGLGLLAWAGSMGVDAAKVYLNPAVTDVPDVGGQRTQAAAAAMSAAGYRVAFVDGENPGQDLGTVISQNPPAGASLHAGRLVTLTVNNPPPLTVPRLAELNVAQVRSALSENRLKLGKVTTIQGGDTNTPKGRVIAQLPEAGATAQRGQTVTLLVSGGTAAQQTWLPPLAGLSFEQARDMARKAGLVVNRVQTQDSDAPENTVLAQSPKPYEKVDVGSPVTLTLARTPRSGPSRPVDSLPLAPPPPPPPAPAPVQPAPDTGTGTNTGGTSSDLGSQGASDAQPVTPENIPATPPDTTGASAAGTSEAAASEASTPQPPTPQPRTVQLRYTFPADLPSGTVEVVVRDLDGERVVVGQQSGAGLAGSVAEGPVQVRGDATFVVRVNGQDYASFNP